MNPWILDFNTLDTKWIQNVFNFLFFCFRLHYYWRHIGLFSIHDNKFWRKIVQKVFIVYSSINTSICKMILRIITILFTIFHFIMEGIIQKLAILLLNQTRILFAIGLQKKKKAGWSSILKMVVELEA